MEKQNATETHNNNNANAKKKGNGLAAGYECRPIDKWLNHMWTLNTQHNTT